MPKCPFCKLHTHTGTELQDHLAVKHPEEIIDGAGSNNRQKRKFSSTKKGNYIVVDGNNICYFDGDPKISNLKKARAHLMKNGYKPIIFVSSALRHDIDNPTELNRLINVGWLNEVEGGRDDDIQVIEEAQRKNCRIVTNDNYKEYTKDYSTKDWKLAQSTIGFSFKDGKFILS